MIDWLLSKFGYVKAPVEIQKATEDFASVAVPPRFGGTSRPEVAQWPDNKAELVNNLRGSAYIAISAIARRVACQEAQVFIQRETKSGIQEEELPWSYPLRELFREVNDFHTQFDLWFYSVMWRLTTGDTYIWKIRNGLGRPVELWPLPSQWVYVMPSRETFIEGYVVRRIFGDDVTIPREDILHIMEPGINWSSTGRFYGFPPMVANALMIDVESAMLRQLWHRFKNYAPPGMVFETDKDIFPNGFNKDKMQDILDWIWNNHAAATDTGKPMTPPAGVKVVDTGSTSVREMDYAASLETAMEWTLATFATPKAAVGLIADCHDEETECLTDDGWKRYDELTFDTKIACYDPESETLHYRKPSGIHIHDYEGPMVQWKGRQVDICVTPNHRLLGKMGDSHRDKTKGDTQWTWKFASEWSSVKNFRLPAAPPNGAACEPASPFVLEYPERELPPKIIVPYDTEWVSLHDAARLANVVPSTVQRWCDVYGVQSAKITVKGQTRTIVDAASLREFQPPVQGGPDYRDDVTIDSDDWMEFLGWFVSEGSTHKRTCYRKHENGRSYKSTSHTTFLAQMAETEVGREIDALLKRMPLKWHRYTKPPTQENPNAMWQWACNDKGLFEHLERYCGKGSRNKRVPSYVKDYPADALRKLLHAAIKGDGSTNYCGSSSYTTTSPQLRDDIQELAIKCGYRSNILKLPKQKPNHRQSYVVSILGHSRPLTINNKQNGSVTSYSGKIWCATVPTGLFVVRRNGRVHITGNSNRANYQAAVTAWADISLNPLIKHMGQHCTQSFRKDYDPRIVVRFPTIQADDADVVLKWMAMMVRHGVTELDEVRQAAQDLGVANLPPLPNDVGKARTTTLNVQEIPSGEMAPSKPDPRTQPDDTEKRLERVLSKMQRHEGNGHAEPEEIFPAVAERMSSDDP